jgi:hypothetical protein
MAFVPAVSPPQAPFLVLEPLVPLPLGCWFCPGCWVAGCWLLRGGAAGASNRYFISLHPSPSAAHLSCNGGWVAKLLRGGSWINNPHNCRAAFRNSNHPDNVNTNVGVRPGCFSPPAPFTVRAVGKDSSRSTRRVTDPRVQTRSGYRRSPVTRSAPIQRTHDPHNNGPRSHGPRPGLPGGLSFCAHTHHTSPAPEATCSSRARRSVALRITNLQRAEGGPERSGSYNRTQRRSTPAGLISMPIG